MIRKLLLCLFFSIGLSLLYLCCCGDYLPHFDYPKIDVGFYDRTQQFPNDSMTVFYVAPDEVEFLAGTYLPVVSNPVFGTSCPMDGQKGPKHALTQMDITADQPLDALHPAGASLNDIFYSLLGDSVRTFSNGFPAFYEFYYPHDFLLIGTPFVAADTAQTFILNVRCSKSDGSTVVGQLAGVKFQ